ncbi:MAG: hypothetical protein M5U12_07715 [Verrucomicrobia bacterium]|nr:hypothetical protein [Verrucomicrobiota bacterium]
MDKIIARVAEFSSALIGIGGIITAYSYIISLSNDIRQAMPNIPIVLGVEVAINNIENCYRYMAIDYIVYGYGEIALGKLAQHLEGKLNIEAISRSFVSWTSAALLLPIPAEFFLTSTCHCLPITFIDMEHYATVNGHRLKKLEKYLDKSGKTAENQEVPHRYGNAWLHRSLFLLCS